MTQTDTLKEKKHPQLLPERDRCRDFIRTAATPLQVQAASHHWRNRAVMLYTRRRIRWRDSGRQTEPRKGRGRATTRLKPNQMKSWSINGPASAIVILTNIMGHLWHEGAHMHHSRPPKISDYGYFSVRRGKPPSYAYLLRESIS